MLTIVVLDETAERRSRLVNLISEFLHEQSRDTVLLPRISVKPLAPQELKFHAAPEICIIGDGVVQSDITSVSRIRKLLPDTAILVRTNRALESISTIEQLARLGADDIITEQISPVEFIRKIILLSRKSAKAKSGKLVVVDSGKGGLGVTSLVAGLGEAISSSGKKVALLDFDFETQDLSRFLQARPFITENLQFLLDQQRPVSEESVLQCMVQVWDDDDTFFCMPPIADSEALYDAQSTYPRTLLSILEIIDARFDCVIVDVGNARGALLRTLYRVADKAVFVLRNDPGCLYASVEKVSRVRGFMAPDAELIFVENAPLKTGLPKQLLREEFNRAARILDDSWSSDTLPDCSHASRWPGSGGTIFSGGSSGVSKGLGTLGMRLGLIDEVASGQRSYASSLISGLKNRLIDNRKSTGTDAIFASTESQPRSLPAPGSKRVEPLLELPESTQLVSSPVFFEKPRASQPEPQIEPVREIATPNYGHNSASAAPQVVANGSPVTPISRVNVAVVPGGSPLANTLDEDEIDLNQLIKTAIVS